MIETALKLKDLSLKSVLVAFLGVSLFGAVPDAPGEREDRSVQEILDRYVSHAMNQQESLRGLQMEMNIDAQLPKLKKSGTFQALRTVSRLGQITYNGLKFIGDNTIKKDVIGRYLQAENETKDVAQLAIVPANYKFKYKGMNVQDDHLVHVFQVSPKKKSVGLFKGEIWLDAQTCLPVRESGRFVKSPSIFLKKIEFVRDYEIRDGIAIPKHIESTVDTRLWGPAEMKINYSNIVKADGEILPVSAVRDIQ